MTTTPVSNTNGTTTIEDTVVSLQGLVTGYSQVLQQAKAQLEQLELTPAQLDAIERKASSRVNYANLIAQLTTEMRYASADADNPVSRHASFMIDAIAAKVTERIADATLARFKDEIKSIAFEIQLDTQNRFKELTRQHFEREESRIIEKLRNENYNLRMTLRGVLSQAYTQGELDAMAQRALAEADTTTTEANA